MSFNAIQNRMSQRIARGVAPYGGRTRMSSLLVGLGVLVLAMAAGPAQSEPASPRVAVTNARSPSSDALPTLGGVAAPSANYATPWRNAAGRYKDMIMLIVDKTQLKAELKTWPENPVQAATLKDFRVAIGKQEGDKQTEGDNKTPEGIYFALSHIDGHTLPLKYGRKAIPIDFPNPMDQAVGKTGHGIWLHGVDREGRVDEAKVTEGCVAFYNADIASLANWLRGYQGVVIIAKNRENVNSEKDLNDVRQRTREWMNSWARRNIDDYSAFYRPDFRFGHQDFLGYRDYKRRVFSSYRKMAVTFDNLRVVTHPKYAVSFFNQDFHGDERFTSIGRKALYWEKGADGQWGIKREVFENRRFEFMTFTDAELASLSDQNTGTLSSEKDKKSPSL